MGVANLRCFANFHPMLKTFEVDLLESKILGFELDKTLTGLQKDFGALGKLTGQTKQTPVY